MGLGQFSLCAAPRDVLAAARLIRRPRAALVVAHPDDEVIGAGALLPHLRDCFVMHVTDGAPRDMRDALAAGFSTKEDYAHARRDEAAAALSLAGVTPERIFEMRLADQETSFEMAALARRLAEVLRALGPGVILTHPYEGGHPDHDSTAFAVHAARRLLARGGGTAPDLIEFTSYHVRDGRMITSEFLHADGCPSVAHNLCARERDLKRRMMECFASQRATLSAFTVEVERFRNAPRYDFTRPPHEGRLHYEHYDWGMTGERWRELARETAGALGLGVTL